MLGQYLPAYVLDYIQPESGNIGQAVIISIADANIDQGGWVHDLQATWCALVTVKCEACIGITSTSFRGV